jgi:FMN-dependent NADH-azoreductase
MSVSRTLTAAIVGKLAQTGSISRVTYRDLAAAPVPHISAATFAAQMIPPNASADEADDLLLSRLLMTEFLEADVVVLGAPMYNFTIPTQLKAWIDRLVVANKTFRYTENGPEGLAQDKRAIIALARGGLYSTGPQTELDYQERYLRAILGFIGISSPEFIRAEGLGISPEHKENAIDGALDAINRIL